MIHVSRAYDVVSPSKPLHTKRCEVNAVWAHTVGIRKSHFYILEKQEALKPWAAMCGVTHPRKVLVPEANADSRCSMCIRAREKEFGLFA